MNKNFLLLSLLILCSTLGLAQAPDTTAAAKPVFSWTGAVDLYYGFDFSRPENRYRQFTTQAYRHNEFNLNYGFLQADYATSRTRATLALHTGTYVQANYAAEPNELTRLIGQANAGFRLTDKTWLDVGILPSHIGYESTFSGFNEVYTRALMAENSPYYETGAQLSHAFSDKLNVKLLLLNGWQNIHETNNAKSVGGGVYFDASEKLSLSYANYFGNEAPDGLSSRYRFFNNFNLKYLFSDRFSLGASADYGRQKLLGSSTVGNWYSGMVLAKYQLAPKSFLSGRAEYYSDEEQVIIFTGTANGFQTFSATLNYNYEPVPGFLYRIEARGYAAEDAVFTGKEGTRKTNLLLVTSLAVKF